MRTMTKFTSTVVLFLLLSLPVLLFPGCGEDVARSQGCPSGSYLALQSDLIVPTPSIDHTVESSNLVPYGGGSFLPSAPITFTVSGIDGKTKNNVCLAVYTGDTATGPGPYWFTDVNYTTLFTGTGPYNYRTVVTNDTGVAILYWSTANLPAANLATASAAGTAQKGTSYIQVYSGARSAIFNFNWTVQGQPMP